jgi:uncharacterized protein YndB with AHSA1/START domain
MITKVDHLIVLPDEKVIVMSRIFNAVPERVWRIYTNPTMIPRWWGPRSLSTVVDKMDVRVGGLWRFVQKDAEGNEYGFHGEFTQIDAPHTLVMTFAFEGMPGHVITEAHHFAALPDGQTKLTTRSSFDTLEALEGMLQSGMEVGTVESWERVDEILAAE